MKESPARRAVLRWGCSAALLGFAGCSGTPGPTTTTTEPSSGTTSGDGTPPNHDGGSTTPVNGETTTETEGPTDDPPILQNLAIEFGPYDPETGYAGDFRFDQSLLESDAFLVADDWLFLPFGTRVDGPAGPKLLPENTYVVPTDTGVRATHDGVVTDVSEMYSGDYAVTTRTTPDANWMVSHEHVRDPSVAVGDRVDAGQILAAVSTVDMEGLDYGWTELAVWRGGATAADIRKVCPFGALAAELKPTIAADIHQFAQDWETFAGRDVYQQETWVMPGCRYEQLTEAESQAGEPEDEPATRESGTPPGL